MKVTDEVYREYSQMVYKYLFSLSGDAHVAEEVTQETFYQAVAVPVARRKLPFLYLALCYCEESTEQL